MTVILPSLLMQEQQDQQEQKEKHNQQQRQTFSQPNTSGGLVVRRNVASASNCAADLVGGSLNSSASVGGGSLPTNSTSNTASATSTTTTSISIVMKSSSSTKRSGPGSGKNSRSSSSLSSSTCYSWLAFLLSCFMVLYVVVVLVVAFSNWQLVLDEMVTEHRDDLNGMHWKGIHGIADFADIETGAISDAKAYNLTKGEDTVTTLDGHSVNNINNRTNESKESKENVERNEKAKQSSDRSNKNKKQPKLSAAEERRKRAAEIFKEHDLTLPLTHGVKPSVLVTHNESVHGEKPIAIKDNHDIATAVEQHPTPNFILKAYIEQSNFDEWSVRPLPIRAKAKASMLQEIKYPRVRSCTKLLQQFPVDDTPVDHDAFLPWIHDVFPTADGKHIQFVAQNKRRCRSGSFEKHILKQMNPQASLFQHVSVQRVTQQSQNQLKSSATHNETRYKLVPHEQADQDAVVTRFICRFKPSMLETLSEFNFLYDWTAYRKRYRASFIEDDAGVKAIHSSQLIFKCPVPKQLQTVIREGTSVVNDYATQFIDVIPIRTPPRWGSPAQYFPPKYREYQNQKPQDGRAMANDSMVFDPLDAWGTDHILPSIPDSGRWENIPICKPSLMTYENVTTPELPDDTDNNDNLDNHKSPQRRFLLAKKKKTKTKTMITQKTNNKKRHKLVSCIWASAGYTTRGNRFAINDGQRRLLEWITYNRVIGFDHFYVYDNSGAFTSDISLKPITDLIGSDIVTYIPWPAQICNNNPNNVDSVGERSSQYAAEQSCRLRFGPHVEWIGQFDIDEYLVPMGKHNNILQLLDELDKENTKIISFASWRAWPRRKFIDPPVPIKDSKVCWHNEPCFELSIPQNVTMLQAYNCDRAKPGQKTESMPAEKQVYKADYVVSHFVHYSVATTLSEKNQTEYENEGFRWKPRAFPDPRQRFANEVSEALMIHTKSVAHQDTAGYERMCHINNTYLPIRRQGLCRLGVPWPEENDADTTDRYIIPGGGGAVANATKEGHTFNCYVNRHVEDYLIPQLVDRLKQYSNFFHQGA